MKYTKEAADFLVYCIEMYKNKYSLSGKETQALFEQTGADIYILDSFKALHTTGVEYTLQDIYDFIQEKKKLTD